MRVTIPFSFEIEGEISEGDSQKLPQKLPQELPQAVQKNFRAIAKNSSATIPELSKTLEVSQRTVKNHIAILRDKYIRRVGSNTKGYWEIIGS